jgi:hypothetical protein
MLGATRSRRIFGENLVEEPGEDVQELMISEGPFASSGQALRPKSGLRMTPLKKPSSLLHFNYSG